MSTDAKMHIFGFLSFVGLWLTYPLANTDIQDGIHLVTKDLAGVELKIGTCSFAVTPAPNSYLFRKFFHQKWVLISEDSCLTFNSLKEVASYGSKKR